MLRSLAEQGVGITLLPETLCAQQVRDGTLEVVLPQWRLPQGIFHAVFASRRGLLPAVRVFIDFLAEKMPPLLDAARLDCRECAGTLATTPRKNAAAPQSASARVAPAHG
jgi:LysR substrate binding domain-containing protein